MLGGAGNSVVQNLINSRRPSEVGSERRSSIMSLTFGSELGEGDLPFNLTGWKRSSVMLPLQGVGENSGLLGDLENEGGAGHSSVAFPNGFGDHASAGTNLLNNPFLLGGARSSTFSLGGLTGLDDEQNHGASASAENQHAFASMPFLSNMIGYNQSFLNNQQQRQLQLALGRNHGQQQQQQQQQFVGGPPKPSFAGRKRKSDELTSGSASMMKQRKMNPAAAAGEDCVTPNAQKVTFGNAAPKIKPGKRAGSKATAKRTGATKRAAGSNKAGAPMPALNLPNFSATFPELSGGQQAALMAQQHISIAANASTANSKKKSGNPPKRSREQSSKYRGVSKCSKDGRWQARIRVGAKVKYLGRFKIEEQAARCYDEHAAKLHGPRAQFNFPEAVTSVASTVPPVVVAAPPQANSNATVSAI